MAPGPAATGIAFVVIASLGVAAPLGVLVTRREQAPKVYDSWRTWILGHNKHIVYGMGAICCAMLIAKGVWGLLS